MHIKENNFVQTSGLSDSLLEDQRDRRFTVVDEARAKQIKQEYGERAQHVDKYKPNRKQKRAQQAAKRQQAGKQRAKNRSK